MIADVIAGRASWAVECRDGFALARALCGSASATDADVKRVVMARISGWPRVSNTHERDAALVALWTAETWAREALARSARP